MQKGPYTIDNLDPRSNDQKPLGPDPIYSKEGYGYTLQDRPEITPSKREWIIQELDKLRHCFAMDFSELPGYLTLNSLQNSYFRKCVH